MKRKDLYNYIREEIIETLSEESVAWITSTRSQAKQQIEKSKLSSDAKKQAKDEIDQNASGLISNVSEADLEEMSRKAGAFTIGDTSKFAEAKDLYSAGLYADVLKAIEEAGDLGLTQKDLGAKLGKGDGSSLNPILNKFKDIGVLVGGNLGAAPKPEKPSKATPKEKPEEPKFDIFNDEEDITPEEKPQVATDKETKQIIGKIDTSKSDEFNKVMGVIKNITDKLQKMKPGSEEYNNKITALKQYLTNNKKILRGQDINDITKGFIGSKEI